MEERMFKKIMPFAILVTVLCAPLFADVTIEIVEPGAGTVVEPCQDILMRANVTSTGDTIQYVYFYVNGTSKGRANGEPWESTSWTNVSTGNYIITAKTRDIHRNEVWAAPVDVKVGWLSNGDKVLNGGFNCGTSTGWMLNIYEDGNGTMTLMDDGYFDDPYYMLYESERATTNWYVQFSQVLPVDSAHVYDIYFLADADEPRTIAVGFQESVDPYRTQVWTEEVEINGADEYRLEGGVALFSDSQNHFKFNLGGSAVPLYLDDIRVIDRSATSVKSMELPLTGGVREFELHQAYPNPFNTNTSIRFTLSQEAEVRLDVYNMIGQRVRTLVSDERAAGTHTVRWDGTDDLGCLTASGVYVYRLTSPSAAVDLSRKLLLLK
jgi:hypothetical protein